MAPQEDKKVNVEEVQVDHTQQLPIGIREECLARLTQLAGDKSLDVGPNERPLFTTIPSLSQLSRRDVFHYMEFSEEELRRVLPEGLTPGMQKEVEESLRAALLIRQSFLDLRDNFRRVVDPPMYPTSKIPKTRRKIVFDGPQSCGKSIELAILVLWARNEELLVFYVPKGKEWTHGGFFNKIPRTGLRDTPLQEENILKVEFAMAMRSLAPQIKAIQERYAGDQLVGPEGKRQPSDTEV